MKNMKTEKTRERRDTTKVHKMFLSKAIVHLRNESEAYCMDQDHKKTDSDSSESQNHLQN